MPISDGSNFDMVSPIFIMIINLYLRIPSDYNKNIAVRTRNVIKDWILFFAICDSDSELAGVNKTGIGKAVKSRTLIYVSER